MEKEKKLRDESLVECEKNVVNKEEGLDNTQNIYIKIKNRQKFIHKKIYYIFAAQ